MRKIIQITGDVNNFLALCDDGTIWKAEWKSFFSEHEWVQVKKIPQDEKQTPRYFGP